MADTTKSPPSARPTSAKPDDKEQKKDRYNPMNMAGKKAALVEEYEKAKEREDGKADPDPKTSSD